MPQSFNNAIPEANLPAPPIDMSNKFKQNLQQVLQMMEAQFKGDAELGQEAIPHDRPRPPEDACV
jgi:hypothetical protein